MASKTTYEMFVRVIDHFNAELKILQIFSVFHDNVYYFLLGSCSRAKPWLAPNDIDYGPAASLLVVT